MANGGVTIPMDGWIGADLLDWRKRQELTQEQVADILDISSRTVIAWEKMETRIKPSIMLACRYIEEHPYILPHLQRKVPLTPGSPRRTAR